MTGIIPAGSVDVHAHVLDPSRRGVPGAAYAPFTASPADYLAHLAGLGVDHGVLVTASTHGTDNEPMVTALRLTEGKLRGVAVVDPSVSDAELSRLDEAGVRAVRVQDRFAGGTALQAIPELARRIAPLNWHLEIWTDLSDHLDWLPAMIAGCGVPVVLDHFGYLEAHRDTNDPGLRAAVDLARHHGTWITLSGAYRLAPALSPRAASQALADRVGFLLDTVPEHLLWGSDWPHVAPPHTTPTRPELLNEVRSWFGTDEERHLVLHTNPFRCYGFD